MDRPQRSNSNLIYSWWSSSTTVLMTTTTLGRHRPPSKKKALALVYNVDCSSYCTCCTVRLDSEMMTTTKSAQQLGVAFLQSMPADSTKHTYIQGCRSITASDQTSHCQSVYMPFNMKTETFVRRKRDKKPFTTLVPCCFKETEQNPSTQEVFHLILTHDLFYQYLCNIIY